MCSCPLRYYNLINRQAGCFLNLPPPRQPGFSVDSASADLDRADLRAADLRHARNLTQKQIEAAYGSSDQQDGVVDTLLPYVSTPKP